MNDRPEERMEEQPEEADYNGDTMQDDNETLTSHASRMALPREHSYLEESHPLLADADLRKHHSDKQTHELAILELQGVVLFPDCTIPVKLRNRSMIKYLGKQIQKCRQDPVAQPRVLIGILPYESSYAPPQPTRRSWMRQRFSFGNGDIAPTASSRRLRQSLTMLRDEFRFLEENEGSNSDSSDSSDSDDNEHMRFPMHQNQSLPVAPSHPLVGRIGTIATVQQTHERRRRRHHEDTQRSGTSHWENYEQADELVFTAVGTSRFKIINCVNDAQNIFEVQELPDASLQRPPISSKLLLRTNFTDQLPSPAECMAWNLSLVTPLPYSLYKHKLPWNLVEKIAKVLQDNQGRGNLPSLGDESIVANRFKLEPRAFSYWMANNAPFSERERLKLLKMNSVLERLLYIQKKVEKMTQTKSEVCCGICGTPLADVADIFVVGGAEGTTSAYVNGHGFIHQITTLRDVENDRKVSFRESPSTENSYFPGYSWWITCCNYCGSMLGWKFQKVYPTSLEDSDDSDESNFRPFEDKDTPERPPYFYGFMSSNVNITEHRPKRTVWGQGGNNNEE